MNPVDLFELMVWIMFFGTLAAQISGALPILSGWKAPAMTLAIGGAAGALISAIAASPSAAVLALLLFAILITMHLKDEFDDF